MAWQQKVGNALANGVLVAAVAADQLAFDNLRLQEEVVQVLEGLFVLLQLLCGRRLCRQFREAKLMGILASEFGGKTVHQV